MFDLRIFYFSLQGILNKIQTQFNKFSEKCKIITLFRLKKSKYNEYKINSKKKDVKTFSIKKYNMPFYNIASGNKDDKHILDL